MKMVYIPSTVRKRLISVLRIATLVSAMTLLPSGQAFAATRVLEWNFNTTTYVDSSGGDTPNTDGAGRAIYLDNPNPVRTDDPSPEGGKHIRARCWDDDAINKNNTQPMFWFTSSPEWNLDEFYIKFYMKIETDIADGEVESIKMFRVNCGNFDSSCNYTINMYVKSRQWHIYETNANGTWSPFNLHPGLQQGRWVRYEFYTKYNTPGQSDGILRIWVDGQLSWEKTGLNFRSSTGFNVDAIGLVYHFKTFGSAIGKLDGHMRFDDVELWDGMPTIPSAPKNLKIK